MTRSGKFPALQELAPGVTTTSVEKIVLCEKRVDNLGQDGGLRDGWGDFAGREQKGVM